MEWRNFKKISRNPKKYKGRGFAMAGIVTGCIMLTMNIIVVVSSMNAASNTTIRYNASSTRCRI